MKKILIILFVFVFLLALPIAAGIGLIVMLVYGGDYTEFRKEKILEILSKETVLYYADGQTQLGSLFGQEHRIYVTIDQIPKTVKNAIVAAEDEDFYSNIGIDPKGILRAAIHNVVFRTRQGASTITQQTVKNLFGRKETDLVVKFMEMINAFKLERMYTKDQILEFYLNQFHVTGNGRGIGVAAKYYFNKEVENLNLVEASFIAGSVKAPDKYNPFNKTTIVGQEKAKKEALNRKNYVLERLFKIGKITADQFKAAMLEPVPFNQGRFQFNEIAVNQIILKQISRPEVLAAIGATTLDEVGTMGLRVTTTLDKQIQTATQYGLRKNLTRIQMILKGFNSELPTNFVNIQKPELYGFYVGKIESIVNTPGNEKLILSFGLPTCVVNTESINATAITLDQAFHYGSSRVKNSFLRSIHVGQYILASVNRIDREGKLFCSIESRPKIQGAAIVIDKGKILGMAGGFSSHEYNRAIFATRQPGSSFKIPTFYAAEQLGWSVLDSVSNMRDVFQWQGIFYFPRPDHPPTTLETTILGASARSENLASVWLLRHMLDKLTYDQFLDLLDFIIDSSSRDKNIEQNLPYLTKKFNVSYDSEYEIKKGIIENIKTEMLSDLAFVESKRTRVFFRTLHFGYDFEKAILAIERDKELSDKEKEIRNNILKNNLLRWNVLAEQAKEALKVLKNIAGSVKENEIVSVGLPQNQKETPKEVSKEKISLTEYEKSLLSNFSKLDDGSLAFKTPNYWRPDLVSNLVPEVNFSSLNVSSLVNLVKADPNVLSLEKILLDGVVPISTLDIINTRLAQKWQDLSKASALQKLFLNADFRYSLGMYYTATMLNNMGVLEPLQWVPSFPLGSNDVTLAELALVYQTILTGKTYKYFNTEQLNQLLLLKRIEDFNGNLLWEAKPKEYQLVDEFFTPATLNAMRGVVTAGTAYVLNKSFILSSEDENIDKQLKAAQIRIPIFGKTGTTNDYKNGTYIGFLPYPSNIGNHELSPENAYTIASYIGYDTNEPMIRKGFKVYGGAAIPAWEEIANVIVKNQNYAEKLNWKDLAEKKLKLIPFRYAYSGLTKVSVPINSGVSIGKVELDDSSSGRSLDPYANDYSESGQRLFHIDLPGTLSDGIFVPKRRVSFYNPYSKIEQKQSGLNSSLENASGAAKSPQKSSSGETSSIPEKRNSLLNNQISIENLPKKIENGEPLEEAEDRKDKITAPKSDDLILETQPGYDIESDIPASPLDN